MGVYQWYLVALFNNEKGEFMKRTSWFLSMLGFVGFLMISIAAMPRIAIAETLPRLLPRLNLEVREIVHKARKAVVVLKRVKKDSLGIGRSISVGSGVIVDKRGYIITNDHVIADVAINNNKRESVVLVTLSNGKIIEGAIIVRDSESDLALVKIPEGYCGDFCGDPIRFGDSDAIGAGEAIVIIGNPLNFEGTVSHGIISFEKREVEKYNLDSPGNEFLIQTDAAINFGASGGILMNDRGEMVGIIKSTTVQHGLRLNIGFAISSNSIKVFLAHALGGGRTTDKKAISGWIGTESELIFYEEYEKINHPAVTLNSMVLRSVFKGGPAAKAGLQQGDIIIGFGKEEFFRDEFEFQRYVRSHLPGSAIMLRVFDVRARILRSVEITAKEKSDLGITESGVSPREEKRSNLVIGAEMELLADYPDILAVYGGFVGPHHFLITNVMPKSPAENAGLQKGDVVVGYDGRSVKDWEKNGFFGKNGFEEYCITKAGDTVSIAIFRKKGKSDIVTVKLR